MFRRMTLPCAPGKDKTEICSKKLSFERYRPAVVLAPPTLGKFGIAEQGVARAVAQIYHRACVRALHLIVVVDRVDPQIQQSVHLGTAAISDHLAGGGNRQKEKSCVFAAGRIIVQHTVVFLPARNFEFYQLPTTEKRIDNQVALLQILKNGKRLMLKSCTEPFRHLIDSAQPFTGIDDIADPINPFIRRAKICVAT